MPDPTSPARIDLKRVVRRFITPLRTATGVYAERVSIVLRLRDAEGRTGYGEIAPWPGFPVETLAEAEAALRSRPAPGAVYASPACLLGELARPEFADRTATPCLDAALSHAKAWAAEGWGSREVALPCAGLLRGDEDLRTRIDAGFRTLKRKIGAGTLRDEQRAVAGLIRDAGPEVAFRLDANGVLDARDCAAWCDFLSEYPEVERLEQPMSPGSESVMVELATRAGVADRLALDESVCGGANLPADFPGVLAVKPLLLGDLDSWRTKRAGFPPGRLSYSSVFETPFGRQAALLIAAETAGGKIAGGFDTLGVFDDALDRHASGPVVGSLSRDPEFWEALWETL